MLGEIYEDYHIMVSANFDENICSWTPRVRIILAPSLNKLPAPEKHKDFNLDIKDKFPTSKDAEDFGLNRARAWVKAQLARRFSN
jgi:hypothetical protein